MKFIEILQGREEGQDKYTFNFHNPLWVVWGAIAGFIVGAQASNAWHYLSHLMGG